ncbi:hypothetical protein FISHEDRAFT_63057 [Fistulina hepatica ATCC 64428]|uniref:Uncharacterized protein n=1 Tax=Fistulina hepatica ATCC 64428 TaxID=1128425 RepID=A0A0D6ZYR4_9AGAR|nr:hypothetical protein FISHEDRAFT_63057 [Fistulina hepatica ATCC 64428]
MDMVGGRTECLVLNFINMVVGAVVWGQVLQIVFWGTAANPCSFALVTGASAWRSSAKSAAVPSGLKAAIAIHLFVWVRVQHGTYIPLRRPGHCTYQNAFSITCASSLYHAPGFGFSIPVVLYFFRRLTLKILEIWDLVGASIFWWRAVETKGRTPYAVDCIELTGVWRLTCLYREELEEGKQPVQASLRLRTREVIIVKKGGG